jgi:hypothetical protein
MLNITSVTTVFFIVIITFVSYKSSPCFMLLNHPVASTLLNKKYKGKRGWCKVKNYSKDTDEEYFNRGHFNCILDREPLVRTS